MIVYFLIIFSVVADTTDKFQESLLETEVLNSNTDDGTFYFNFFLSLLQWKCFSFLQKSSITFIRNNKKKCQTLFFLVQLKHTKVPPEELVQLYVACIKFVLFFGCQVFLFRLPQYGSLTFEWKQ